MPTPRPNYSDNENQRLIQIKKLAGAVPDPELPFLTLDDLGVIRDVLIDEEGNHILYISPTYTGCPATEFIMSEVVQELNNAGHQKVLVKTTLSPAWTTDWITENGRKKMLEHGLVPPKKVCDHDKDNTTFDETISITLCPRCRSENTEKISEFGATPCKALWRCLNCLEPFEYFKCL